MSHSVSEIDTPAQATAVIREESTWAGLPGRWPALLDAVWAAVRSSKGVVPNRNVMVYLDDVPHVEVGVEVGAEFPLVGRVLASSLPAGRAAMTTHRGSYADLPAAHRAVVSWCDRNGRERLGPRWEVYGHVREGDASPEVEVYHLIR